MGEVREVVLSKRLKCLADMVTPGNGVADVGCDHGFLSVYLVQKGISQKVLAMDVRMGPLSRAGEHIAAYELGDYIETRLSDGLSAYHEGEAQTLVCAGMGGRLMKRILSAYENKTRSFQELILQPQSELYEFRLFLRENGYEILQENILCEEGKYYFMMKVSCGHQPSTEDKTGGLTNSVCEQTQRLYDRYGEKLLLAKHPVLKEYLLERQQVVRQIEEGLVQQDKERARERLSQVREELLEISQALEIIKKEGQANVYDNDKRRAEAISTGNYL